MTWHSLFLPSVCRAWGSVRIALLLALAACARPAVTPAANPVPNYPPTRTSDVADDYHGTRVADPYQWLENIDSPEVRAWAAAQNAFTDRQLADDPLRGKIAARMRELGEVWDSYDAAMWPASPASSIRPGPVPGGTHRGLLVKRDGKQRVLVDPRRFGADVEISRFEVSPDSAYVSYGLSRGGSEWVETRIVRVADGRELPEVLHRLLFVRPIWTHDGRGFFYVHQRRPSAGERVMFSEPAVFYHVVGTPQERDRAIFRTSPGTTDIALDLTLSPDGRFLLVTEGSGAHGGGAGWLLSRVHLLDLREPRAPAPTRKLVALTDGREAAHHLVGQDGSVLYFMTDRNAPKRRIVAVDVRDSRTRRWREVIPESDAVIARVLEIGGRWVVLYVDGVHQRLRVFERNGKLVRQVPIPPLTTVLDVRSGDRDSELVVGTTSLLTPYVITRHDLVTGAATVLRTAAVSVDTTAFETREVSYPSRDGTKVPMFLLHRRGLRRDGSHPTMLFGYGASSELLTPENAEHATAWAELGGIVAWPAPRGGGNFGRGWWEAGTLDRKQNTFDDFIAAAEWLIAERYTSPEKLGIRGASFGGLLVSAVVTQQPDLFAVAIAEVPIVDVLRFDLGRHRAQIGTATDPRQFAFLHAFAPLQRVRPGTCYPAMLITTNLNDERAPAWHALKLGASLQRAQSCPRPILLRVNEHGGHGDAAFWPKTTVERMAFAMRQLGARQPMLRPRTASRE